MKKIYMLFSAAALCACALFITPSQVSAQVQLGSGLTPPSGANRLNHRYVPNHAVNNLRSNPTGNWLEYWFVADSLGEENGNTPAGYYVYLFPDSNVQICSGGTCQNPEIHLIGNVLDPSSTDMQRIENYTWSNTSPYYVDSLSIVYSYNRNSDPGVVDTLLVYLWDNAVASDLPVYYYAGFAAYYGVDTVQFAEIMYDSTGTNMPKASANAIKTFKILLTEADTATIGVNNNVKVIDPHHFSVPAGKLVATAYGFKPGYSYSPGDTVSSTANIFTFITDQPNGNPSYGPYTPGDYNVSEIVENSVRYNTNTQGYDGFFLPSFAFTSAFQLQDHVVSYYVTQLPTGINESTSPGGLKLYQNQPNPANHSTTLRYETETAGAVVFEVRDLTGRLVMELNEGTQSAGMHNVVVDISGLSQGTYLYTLRTDKESITRRMVISE